MNRATLVSLASLFTLSACEAAHPRMDATRREFEKQPYVAPAFIESEEALTDKSAREASAPAPQKASAPAPQKALPSSSSKSQPDVSLFYESLAPYGEWTELAPYGWVWLPRDVAVGWQPYTTGHWAYADEAGWTWVADEAWGWAPFHYGRWTFDENLGWAWAPGKVWGPAWVTWRYGERHIGWAALPPVAGWDPKSGVDVHGFDLDATVGSLGWNFVALDDLANPNLRDAIVVRARNATILGHTPQTANVVVDHGRVFDGGIEPGELAKNSKASFAHVAIRDLEKPDGAAAYAARGSELAMYRPELRDPPVGTRPKTVALAEGQISSGDDAHGFLQREADELDRMQKDEEARLAEMQQRDLGQASGEDAVRELQRQQAIETQLLQRRHERERTVLEQRQLRAHRPVDGAR